MKPLVSIIIPVYNSGKYLHATLNSVNNQSYQNKEVIIINDASTDSHTISILEGLEKQYTVLHPPKVGLAGARNLGIEKASGTYILPLDSDDLIDDDFIERAVFEIEKDTSIELVRSNIRLFGKKKGTIKFPAYSYNLLLARNIMVATSLFKRASWVNVGGYDPQFDVSFEDWDFWLSILKGGGKVATINDPIFHYRIRGNSKNHSIRKKELAAMRRKIWNKHKEEYAKYFVDPKESFEYYDLVNSKAVKLGNLLLKPFSFFKLIKD